MLLHGGGNHGVVKVQVRLAIKLQGSKDEPFLLDPKAPETDQRCQQGFNLGTG
jgi:hypothetical protein